MSIVDDVAKRVMDKTAAGGSWFKKGPAAVDQSVPGFFGYAGKAAPEAASSAASHGHSIFGNDAPLSPELGGTLMAGAGVGTLGLLLSKIRGDQGRAAAAEIARQQELARQTAESMKANQGWGDTIMDGISGAATKIKDWWDGK